MLGLGLIGIAAIAFLPAARASPLARWILLETLAPARVLPLIGLAAAFGLIGTRAFIAALFLLAVGVAGGLVAEYRLLWALDMVPQAAAHLFLTSPISYAAAGAALIFGARPRSFVTPVAALIVGAMLALMIKLTDPSLHQPAFIWMPVLIAFWIVAAISLTLRAFPNGWFPIFARILGSWLLAIGLLYGGASLVPKRQLPPPPTTLPGSERTIP